VIIHLTCHAIHVMLLLPLRGCNRMEYFAASEAGGIKQLIVVWDWGFHSSEDSSCLPDCDVRYCCSMIHFRGLCCHHLQGEVACICAFFSSLPVTSRWRQRQHSPLKHWDPTHHYTVSHPRRLQQGSSLIWKSQVSLLSEQLKYCTFYRYKNC